MAEAVLPLSYCPTKRILFLGKDIYEAAVHDLEAITSWPAWAYLHRRDRISSGMTHASNWNRRTAACQDRQITQQCDEYPFGASYEGWRGDGTTPYPSTKLIDLDDNNREGNVLRQFYNALNPGDKILFKGCTIANNPRPAEWEAGAPMPPPPGTLPPVANSDYIVVPMPEGPFDSFAICGE